MIQATQGGEKREGALREDQEPSKNHNTILESKLRPPRLRQVLERPRLLLTPEAGTLPRVINICAAAGFGKTTLMAQMAQEFDGSCVWYQVDELDRDPAVFLRHIIAGITRACGFDGMRARARLDDATDFSIESQSVVAVLFDELREHTSAPLMLCFDDFHVLDKDEHTSGITANLIQSLPKESRVVIASRRHPEFRLGRLRSQGLLLELDDGDLQFSLEEISDLADIWNVEMSSGMLDKVHKRTEGWAAGLVLTEGHLKSGSDFPDLFSQHRLQQNVYEYLAEEVLNNQSDEMQELLINTSLIDPVDPAICDRALGSANTGKMLAKAEQQNLFASRLDDAEMYRYHPLFREFLRSKLSLQVRKEEVSHLRARFANAFVAAGQEREAIEQFLAAGMHPEAVELMEILGDKMLDSAEYATLEKWIASLQEKHITPAVQIQRAKILMSAGKFRKALNDLRQAEKRIDPSVLSMFSKSIFAHCDCLNELGKTLEAIEILNSHLSRSLPSEFKLKIIWQLALSYWIVFDQSGIESCLEMVRATICEDDAHQQLCCTNIAEMQNMRQGNFVAAYKTLANYRNREGISNSQKYFYENNLASCLMLMGKYEEALELASHCEQEVRKHCELKLLPSLLDTLGCIHIANGNVTLGKQLLDEALNVAIRIDQKRADVPADLLCHLGTLARRQGNFGDALKYHSSSLSEATSTNELYEVAMSNANIAADLLRISKYDEADEHFIIAERLADQNGLHYVLTQTAFSRAWAGYVSGDEKYMKRYLVCALRSANELQHNHYILQEGKISLSLFSKALDNGIEIDYVFWILAQIGEESLGVIEPLLKHDDKLLRENIARLLCDVGSTGALTLLRRMRYDSDEKVQATVRKSLERLRKGLNSPSDLLTAREVEILEILSTGLTNRQIAEKLYISERTVKTHVVKIFRKMGFTSRLDAALYFQKQAEKNTTFQA